MKGRRQFGGCNELAAANRYERLTGTDSEFNDRVPDTGRTASAQTMNFRMS